MRLILLLLIFPLITFSQTVIDSVNQTIITESITEVDLTQKEIREKAMIWAAKTFKNVNNVERLNTEDKFIAKGIFNVRGDKKDKKAANEINFTLDLAYKEGKYKSELSVSIDEQESYKMNLKSCYMGQEFYKEYLIESLKKHRGVRDLDESLKKEMISKMTTDEKVKQLYLESRERCVYIFDQIETKLNAIDLSLAKHMIQESDEDDW